MGTGPDIMEAHVGPKVKVQAHKPLAYLNLGYFGWTRVRRLFEKSTFKDFKVLFNERVVGPSWFVL